ncbi:MAG: haloacid dehalogenase [Hyphomicrobiales bacterium]|nr:haloacid dehalogenase [Hyphomicrobiales bacterium]
MTVAPTLASMGPCEPSVVAFDGDDTLWRDGTSEQDWERRFKHLAAGRLPSRAMEEDLRARLKQTGFTIDGVRDALLASGREACGEQLPPEWLAEVETLPELAGTLKIEPTADVDEALDRFSEAGHVLWIITKGDVVLQSIKLARFAQCHRFSRIEIVPRKTAPTYRRILAAAGVEPGRFLMIGDALTQDVLPVLRLGARAAHVPAGRWTLLRPLVGMLPTKRLKVCRTLGDAARICVPPL